MKTFFGVLVLCLPLIGAFIYFGIKGGWRVFWETGLTFTIIVIIVTACTLLGLYILGIPLK